MAKTDWIKYPMKHDSRGGKHGRTRRKKLPALMKITREINQKHWRANHHSIYLENRVFSSWRKICAEGSFGNDSVFASWLLGLELRQRQENEWVKIPACSAKQNIWLKSQSVSHLCWFFDPIDFGRVIDVLPSLDMFIGKLSTVLKKISALVYVTLNNNNEDLHLLQFKRFEDLPTGFWIWAHAVVICKLAQKWYLMHMCTSWLCPFNRMLYQPDVSPHVCNMFSPLLSGCMYVHFPSY